MNGLELVAAIVLTLASQLALAALAVGTWARWHARASAAALELARVALPSVAALVLSVLVLSTRAGDPGGRLLWPGPVLFIGLGVLPTAGSFLTLRAGAHERRGRLARGRRLVRRGGLALLTGILLQLALVWLDLLFRPAFRVAAVRESLPSCLLLVAGMLALGGAAFVGVLAALSGKPRPSGQAAAALYVAGMSALVAAAQLA